MSKKELHTLTAVELSHLIKNKKLSAIEVSKVFAKRSGQINSELHAFVAFDAEYAIAQAKKIEASDQDGLLKGVPVGIKDVFNTEFYPTQKGTPVWKGYKAGNDARCVSYLRNSGAIIFAKTDTAELAVHANGKALNPYRLSHVTGSSSGGSAAAVATAMVPVALGTQTGGSIMRPASWCGVYAMKPSFGLIPRTGVLKTTDTLDNMGFFGRSVGDLKLMLDVMRIHGDNFPIQEKELRTHSPKDHKKWRIAFCKPSSPLLQEAEAYVLEALETFKSKLMKIKEIEVIEVALPKSTFSFRQLHRRIYHPCLAYYLKSEYNKGKDQLSKTLLDIFEDAKTIPSEDYSKALNEQAALAADLEQFFADNQIDVLFMHSSNGAAPVKAEPPVHRDCNALWTMAWLPVVNIPQFKSKEGFPFGLQAIGVRYSDYKILAILNDLTMLKLIPEKSEIVEAPFLK